MEVLLTVLLMVASAIGAVFWRKSVLLRDDARNQVEELRENARENNALREKTVQANLESLDEEITAVSDDRKGRTKLAGLLNRALDD
jgi:hypothetical protein